MKFVVFVLCYLELFLYKAQGAAPWIVILYFYNFYPNVLKDVNTKQCISITSI